MSFVWPRYGFVPLGFDVICLDYCQTIQHETNLRDHYVSGIPQGSVQAASSHYVIMR
jgi:hypothetical protein